MNDLFLKACYGKPVERTPVWIMRQAGRYLPEYRAVRAEHDFWTVCRTPELASKVTIQPIDRLDVDAAILFSDILVTLPPMGCDVMFNPAPEIAVPVRSRAEVDALSLPDPEKDLGYVMNAIRTIRNELKGRVPLIGFGGAPATLAAYMVEGGGGGKFHSFRSFLYQEPEAAKALLDHLVKVQSEYLVAQIEAGAQAIQIFDSWGGLLPRAVYERFALDPVRRLVEAVRRPGVPVIYYIRDAAHLHDLLGKTGADVLSLDEKTPLGIAAERIGPGPALQGNLDNTLLFASKEAIDEGVARVLSEAPAGRGHVFNLGHGILPGTPVESTIHLVESVRRRSRRGGEGETV